MTLEKIEKIVNESLKELMKKDILLLQNDVSERAITHKLAEYIQKRIPTLHVDCEYNRNVEEKKISGKKTKTLRAKRINMISTGIPQGKEEDDLLAISTYPDIIVHRRARNNENLLVAEVKKRNSKINHEFDYLKLIAFTEFDKRNPYHYKYGVFIRLDTGKEKLKKPELTWFIEGKEIK